MHPLFHGRLPQCAGLLGTKFCAGRDAVNFNLTRRPRPTRPQTYIPIPNPHPKHSPTPLGGSKSNRAVTRLCLVWWWRFSKSPVRPKCQPRPKRPAPCTKCCPDQSCALGRVPILSCSVGKEGLYTPVAAAVFCRRTSDYVLVVYTAPRSRDRFQAGLKPGSPTEGFTT